jgi:hypothetical protein
MVVDVGVAALVAAGFSALVALVSLVVSIRTERERVYIGSELSTLRALEEEKRNLLYTQLTEFYDPIYALLSVNESIFDRIGPNSDVRYNQSYPIEETAAVWNELVQTVIVPNNIRICEIIETRLHLIALDDTVEPYLQFTTHAHAYKVFQNQPYESYELFQFPAGFPDHIYKHRQKLRKRIESLFDSDQD